MGTNRGGGGTESHFVTLALAMHKTGHTVAAVVYPGSPIHTGLSGSGVQLYNGTFRNAVDPRGIIAVLKASGNFHPDWIISSFSKEYWPLALIARALRVKLALFKHMDFPLRPTTRYFIPRLADRFIVISEFMRERFIASGIPPSHIQVLYNPLDLDYFHVDPVLRRTTRESWGINETDLVLGFIGAMHRDKGIFMLAEAVNQAMARLPNLKAVWIGEGPHSAEFAAYIANSGYGARHIIHKWSTDVRPNYAAMDMLAMPTTKTETFGRVSIEAQASGVPVLCSKLGGIPETLQPDVTGKLLPPGDIPAWRDAILAMAGDVQLRQRMQEQGRSWVTQQFSAPVIARQFERMLEQQS
ncbi:MAG: glycosyltransferase family 4 protein [Nitrosomonadales bacterium]|nr:glycosyltransferase family 4 protein [Nitrosomonadales bacterium]